MSDYENDIESRDDYSEIFDAAMQSFNRSYSACWEERKQSLNDRRFSCIAGAMYEGKLEKQYGNGAKPNFEINKIQIALNRLLIDYRSNRFGVTFKSRDGATDDETADTLSGLLRADEYDSDSTEAYDNAFDECGAGGIGAWRVSERYEDELDEENENQRIVFEPIHDAETSVFWPAGAKKYNKSDANECWVITAVDRQQYADEWGDDPASWPKPVNGDWYDWSTPDVVYVAEYYKKETVTTNVHTYKNIAGVVEKYTDADFDADPELKAKLRVVGSRKIKTRKIKERRVHKYLMSGSKILEDCGIIAGTEIPIIMLYGRRFFISNVERCAGEARYAKDAARLKNMQITQLAMISANSPIEKPIFSPEQMAGHTALWQKDDVENYPYLLINTLTDAAGNVVAGGPLGYTKPPALPPAMAALLQISEADLQDILGNSQQADKMVGGIAEDTVAMIQQRVDSKNIIYMDNFAKSLKWSAQVWLGKAKELYTTKGRKMKSLSADNEVSQVTLQQPAMINGEIGTVNDLTRANMDVYVEIGPSSNSKRAATVNSLTKMLGITTDPETKAILESATMMNMDGEGMSEYRAYFRKKLLRMGAVKPTREEAAELAAEQSGPDAQQKYLLAAAEEATANAAAARAKTVNVIADAEYKRAKTTETLAGIDMDSQTHAIKMAQDLSADVMQQTATAQPNLGE